MTNFLNILALIVKLIPLIKEAVLSLETAFPDTGNGAAKKAILNETLDQAVKVSNEALNIYEQAKPALSIVIDSIVKLTKKPKTDTVTTVIDNVTVV